MLHKILILLFGLCQLTLAQISFLHEVEHLANTDIQPVQNFPSLIGNGFPASQNAPLQKPSKPKTKPKQVYESTGLISGSGSGPSLPKPVNNPLGLNWNPIKPEPVEIPETAAVAESTLEPEQSEKPYMKWDCLWTSECDTPAAHLYCGKGCRAIHITTRGQNKCFDGCCRCLRNTTEVPQPLTQEYFLLRNL